MNAPNSPNSLKEYDVYEALYERLCRVPFVTRVEKIGDKVYVLFCEAGRCGLEYVSRDVRGVFEEIDKDDLFEYVVWETSRDLLEISEVEREMLEARVRARVGELTEFGTLHGEIESVRVRWTFLSRILRAIGVDSHESHGVITLRDLDIGGFADRTLLLRALIRDFGIPMSIRGASNS